MPVLVLVEVPGVTAEDDRAMSAELGFDDGSIAGCRLRLAGPSDSGWRVATLWDSLEAFEAFRDGRLASVLQQTGRPVPTFQIRPVESVSGL